MKRRVIIVLALGTIAFAAMTCKRKPAADLSTFQGFYERFHSDSLYQMEHILFPLEGLPSVMDTTLANVPDFRWTESNWRMHRAFDFEGSEYEQTLATFGEDVVVEKIMHQTGAFGMLRRFARMDGEWYLIYFADMNPVKKLDSGINIEGGF